MTGGAACRSSGRDTRTDHHSDERAEWEKRTIGLTQFGDPAGRGARPPSGLQPVWRQRIDVGRRLPASAQLQPRGAAPPPSRRTVGRCSY